MTVAATRDRITEAALGLIAERGLSDVTMIDIARTAGIARQTLYNHYPDVASIVADATSRHNDTAIAQLRQALAVVATPTDSIQQLVRHVAAITTHGGHTLGAHHGLPAELRQQLLAFDDELDHQISQALTAGIERGDFRPDLDPTVDTRLVRHQLNAVSDLVADTPDAAPQIVTNATRTILAAIRKQQP